jgi:hypothetical protein
MSESPLPRRRWFQFGLRTMFVVVTLFAMALAWVGYSLNWVRQRQRFLSDPRMCVVAEQGKNCWGLLWLFGESSFSKVSLATHSKLPHATEDDVTLARRLFPEATVGSKLFGSSRDEDIEEVYRTRSIDIQLISPD